MLDINIKRLYHNDQTLAENIALQVHDAEKIVVTGVTGCGKSSLLKTFNLFNFDYDGDISFQDKKLSDYQPCQLRSDVIYLMQEPFLSEGIVSEILPEPFSFKCKKHLTLDENDILRLFDFFHLPKALLKKQVKQLSGGEKQRISLIQAFLLKPRILLLDEPSSALDSDTSRDIA